MRLLFLCKICAVFLAKGVDLFFMDDIPCIQLLIYMQYNSKTFVRKLYCNRYSHHENNGEVSQFIMLKKYHD